eukprot:TRINITY_DN24485_c0_g1_i1.p1 TRINITY_DN24485_c0_g1~~TRINITY_DN24485_c0_g1_i1.p1  ORF type:complete len:354 (+),score=88.05 TRINITY_DN24485_c0_g1_i1:131-1192(+)
MCIRDRHMAANAVKFMVAVDAVAPPCWNKPGSPLSHKAFAEACAMRQPGDRMVVYHCANPFKYPDPDSVYLPDKIVESFKQEAVSHGIDPLDMAGEDPLVEFIVETKETPEHKVRDKIVEYSRAAAVDVLFLGAWGIKGMAKPGQAPLEEGQEREGSSAQAAVETAPCTVVVVKLGSFVRRPGQDARFMVAVDGSPISYRALMQTCHLCQSGDEVVAVTIGEHSSESQLPPERKPEMIVERCHQILECEFHLGKAIMAPPDPDCNVGQQILDLSGREDIAATYLVIGSSGASLGLGAFVMQTDNQFGAPYLGSVAQFCVRHARLGVVVVKERSRDLRPTERLVNKGGTGCAIL